ncbi:MAG: nucleoside 2-deoxyribosyltransferase [Patescibacteria group bacterium]|nr:nucleoside 2-deoxyribosyltransferase [Patescibacteria group bacterium]
MKVYFVGSIIGRDEKVAGWQRLVTDTIKERGEEIDTVNVDTRKGKLFHETEEQVLQAYTRNTKSIKHSDVIVAEVSVSDSGVGYEIAYALNQRKPVLALYHEEAETPTAPPIQAGGQKLLTFAKYNEKNIKEVIDSFFREVRNKLDTKFILIISPEIDRYLEWAGDYKRMHKAQIVRNSVEKEIESDKDYQKFLEEKDT